MRKFKSFLDHAAEFAAHVVQVAMGQVLPVAVTVAQQVKPVFKLVLPMYGPLFERVVSACYQVEQAYAGINKGTGSGAQKLQMVLAMVGDELKKELTAGGIADEVHQQVIESYVTAIVALMNGPAVAVNAITPAQ